MTDKDDLIMDIEDMIDIFEKCYKADMKFLHAIHETATTTEDQNMILVTRTMLGIFADSKVKQ